MSKNLEKVGYFKRKRLQIDFDSELDWLVTTLETFNIDFDIIDIDNKIVVDVDGVRRFYFKTLTGERIKEHE